MEPNRLPDRLPDLSALTLKPREQLTREASNGIYCIDTTDGSKRGFKIAQLSECKSSVILVRNAVNITDEEASELDTFMSDNAKVPPTVNPMNTNTVLKRKQATFGASYAFSGHKVPSFSEGDEWPRAVGKALAFSKAIATQLKCDPELFNAVHTNLYPSGATGVREHKDEEGEMAEGKPILSYTLLTGERKPRAFVISMRETQKEYVDRLNAKNCELAMQSKTLRKSIDPQYHEVATVNLNHNDLLIMQGNMQSKDGYYHSIPEAKPPKEYRNARRLNLTVRAFKSVAVERVRTVAFKLSISHTP